MKFFKSNDKKEPEFLIKSKVYIGPEETYVRARKKKPIQWLTRIKLILVWIKNYLKSVGWIFFVGLAVVLILVFTTTPMFSIKPDKIELVLKPEPVFDRTAIMSILRDYAGKNIFTVSTGDIFQRLSENIRHIASVEKSLDLPDGMHVTVTSFSASYRAKIEEDTFLLTENGQLITDIPEVEVPTIEIHHLVQDPNLAKSTPITGEDMFSIRRILDAWGRTFGDTLVIDALMLYEQEKELHIVHGSARLIFLLENGADVVPTLQKLLSVDAFRLENQVYVDLRIPNRIFSCPKGEATACSENIRNSYE